MSGWHGRAARVRSPSRAGDAGVPAAAKETCGAIQPPVAEAEVFAALFNVPPKTPASTPPHPSERIKIMLAFSQIVSPMAFNLNVKFPTIYLGITNFLGFLGFEILPKLSLECWVSWISEVQTGGWPRLTHHTLSKLPVQSI